MPRVLVCGEDQLAVLRIGRILSGRNRAYDVTKTSVKKDDLIRYDLLIVHSSWRLPHLFEFIANVVRDDGLPVVFLSGDTAIGAVRPLIDNPRFAIIEDLRADAELDIAVTLLLKTSKALREIGEKSRKEIERADLRRQMDQCKQRLIASGMTEAEAHALILKTAMDRQISKYAACAVLLAEKNAMDD
jgi:AmiR/NasT family two-component response regulator